MLTQEQCEKQEDEDERDVAKASVQTEKNKQRDKQATRSDWLSIADGLK